jgi:hypothetical protein
MHTVELVFAIGWTAFWVYWLVAAFSMKRGRVSREPSLNRVRLNRTSRPSRSWR